MRHLVRGNFLHPFNQRRRTPPTSPRERRALGTTAGTNAALFSSSSLSHSSSACRSSEARRGVPCGVAVSSLVHTSRCLEPSLFSFASFFTKTCVEIATRTRDDERTRTFKRDNQKGSRCAAFFFKLSLRRRRRMPSSLCFLSFAFRFVSSHGGDTRADARRARHRSAELE